MSGVPSLMGRRHSELTRKGRRAYPGGSKFLRSLETDVTDPSWAGNLNVPARMAGLFDSKGPKLSHLHLLEHAQRRQWRFGPVRRADLPHKPRADIAKENGRRLIVVVARCVAGVP